MSFVMQVFEPLSLSANAPIASAALYILLHPRGGRDRQLFIESPFLMVSCGLDIFPSDLGLMAARRRSVGDQLPGARRAMAEGFRKPSSYG